MPPLPAPPTTLYGETCWIRDMGKRHTEYFFDFARFRADLKVALDHAHDRSDGKIRDRFMGWQPPKNAHMTLWQPDFLACLA